MAKSDGYCTPVRISSNGQHTQDVGEGTLGGEQMCSSSTAPSSMVVSFPPGLSEVKSGWVVGAFGQPTVYSI